MTVENLNTIREALAAYAVQKERELAYLEDVLAELRKTTGGDFDVVRSAKKSVRDALNECRKVHAALTEFMKTSVGYKT